MTQRDVTDGGGDPVDGLLFECLERVDAGEPLEDVVTALAAAHPEQADALRKRVASLRSVGMLGGPDGGAPPQVPERLGEFRVLRRLGGGGMGVVYLAEQPSVGRCVALKLVRLDQLHREDVRARFRREVGAAARLAHPDIVQVYTVGEERGLPYLAMEYVVGSSLEALVARNAHASPGTLTGEDLRAALAAELEEQGERGPFEWDAELFQGSWRDACVRIARRVAEALQHAHGRGVLHRDVKPSNVMITPEGRVLLLDFGLATVAGADKLTRTGSELGSLPYMPPEQLGERPEPDRRGDVYSLGVTLYELLTLRSPFLDVDSGERTRRRILEGRPTPPRKLDPSLGADLQTVCLVAMDRDPERRYRSAGALAGDLTNVLERRPIAARPAGLGVQLRRWARRRPAAATAVAMGALVLTAGPTVLALQEANARARIQAQFDRAERNYRRALGALDLVTDIAEHELVNVPAAVEPRRRLLHSARDFFLSLQAERRDDVELRLEAALAQVRVASIERALDGFAEAERILADAIAELEELQALLPGRDLSADLGRAHADRGQSLYLTGRAEEAAASFARADALLTSTHARSQDPDALLDLALARARAADLWRTQGQLEAAEHELARGTELMRGLVEELGANRHFVYCGWTLTTYGMVLHTQGRYPEAHRELREAVAVLEEGVARWPRDRDLREQLCQSLMNLGSSLRNSGALDEALAPAERAHQLAQALFREYPEMTRVRGYLAATSLNLSVFRLHAGELDPAAELLEIARANYARLVEQGPEVVLWRWHTAVAEQALAQLEIERGRWSAALSAARDALRRIDAVERLQPGIPDVHATRAQAVASLVTAHRGLGQHAEAFEAAARLGSPADVAAFTQVAGELAAGMALAEEDPALADDARLERVMTYYERALELLGQAAAAGPLDRELLGSDERFDPLRGDETFEGLLEAPGADER